MTSAATPDRIDFDEEGVDDVVLSDVLFRMERMSPTTFWIRCYREAKPDLVFILSVEKGKLSASHYED